MISSFWNKLMILANLDSRNGIFFLTDCEFTKNVMTPVIALFTNSNNCWAVTS